MAEPAPHENERLRDLVAECLAAIEEHGPAALERMCAEHPEHAAVLRRRVALLQGLEGIGGPPPIEQVPEVLGDFRLLRPLGGGGMGMVYLALQQSLGREVALKVIRPEQLYFPRARERFRREVETIARLKHPGIVPIYAVGEENGVPYFAMERIHGRSLESVLDALRDRAPESLAGRDLAPEGSSEDYLFHGSWETTCLRIVRQVAEALAHAHEQGVLHRDVKPSNVMLASDGPSRALLVDFGLATAEGSDRLTRTGAQVGTLHYMSPEQVRGDGTLVGPRSDVYSLGVTLYELLTLRRPFEGRSDAEVLVAIQQGARRRVRDRNPGISRDAETVCLTAIETDPGRRYASAGDFARDLANVLDHRPVEARPVGLAVRAARWTRRHPAASAALAMAVLIVAGGPGLYAWQERRAAVRILEQRDVAEASLEQALAAVDRMLTRVGDVDLRFVPQMEPVRRALLEDAVELLENLLARGGDDPRVLEFAATARERLGELFMDLGQVDEALGALEASLATLERAAPDADPARSAVRIELESRARRSRALALQLAGHSADAIAEHGRAAEVARELPRDVLSHPSWRRWFANQDAVLANLHRDAGDTDEARARYARALEELERLASADSSSLADLEALAEVSNEHGLLLLRASSRSTELNEPARAAFERAIELYDRICAASPRDPEPRYVRATAKINLAGVWSRTGDYERAAGLYAEALETLREVTRLHPENVNFRLELATCINQLGLLADQQKRYPEAEARYTEALAELRGVLASSPGQHLMLNRVGITEHNLAAMLHVRGELAGALEHFGRAAALQREAIALLPESEAYVEDLARALRGVLKVTQEQEDWDAAASAAEAVSELPVGKWQDCTRAAARLAKCCELARGSPSPERDERVAELARRACAHLRRAILRGMPDPSEIPTAPPLAALVGTAAFDELVEELR